MKLYYLPGASPLAAHIVLEWIGEPYEAVRMGQRNFKASACPAPGACDAAPMLEHDDLALTESVAILGYLADLHPDARLLGDGTPRGRAEVMHWLAFLHFRVNKALATLFKASFGMAEEMHVEHHALQPTRRFLERLDAQLADRDWLVGTRSIADPYLLAILRWAAELDISFYGLQHLMRFARRVEDDPGVQAAILAQEGVLA